MRRRTFLFSGAALFAAGALKKGEAKAASTKASVELESCPAQAALPDRDFKNFEFSADFKTSPQAKGFLAFHSNDDLSKGYKIAIQNDYSGLGWWRMSGSLLGVRNIVKNMASDGEWFNLKLKVHGALIEVWLNGYKMVEYIEPEKPFRTPENENARLSSGKFKLCCESGGNIDIRNVKIKELSDRRDVKNQQWSAIDETADPVIRLHQRDFPVFDSHVHLKGGLTVDWAMARSRKLGINYGICPNCGRDFQINRPEMASDFLDEAKSWPCLIGMQAEGREWHKIFPESIRARFDYVFTDAMTFNDAKGNRTHVWMPHEVLCQKGEEEAYMEWIAKTVCSVVAEPSDIYANPLWLPEILNKNYDKYWTKERKERVLEAIVKANKPMEINTTLDVPHTDFIEAAHKAGVKFTFATNNANPEFSPFGVEKIEPSFGRFSKVLKVADALNLTAQDLYRPRRANA